MKTSDMPEVPLGHGHGVENDMPLVHALVLPAQFLWALFLGMLAEQSGGVTGGMTSK
jgi:hypothetical protein